MKDIKLVIDKLETEHSQLSDKLVRLRTIMMSDKYKQLCPTKIKKFLSRLQLEAMEHYQHALSNRLQELKGKALPRYYDFSEALMALNFRLGIRRKGWANPYIFVFKITPHDFGYNTDFYSKFVPPAAYEAVCSTGAWVEDVLYMYDKEERRLSVWNPTTSDLFYPEWEIVLW